MLQFLLVSDIKKYLRYKDIHSLIDEPKKTENTIKVLLGYAEKSGHSIHYLVRAYAWFFVEALKQQTLISLYTYTVEFMDRLSESIPQEQPMSKDDALFALDVEREWIDMKTASVSDMPIQARKFVNKKHIIFGRNTTFPYSRNYIAFASVAHFINLYKKEFPMLHGIREFFLAIPTMRGYGIYPIEFYYYPRFFLNLYYEKVYGDTPTDERLSNMIDSVPLQKDQIEVYEKSSMLGSEFVVDHLKEKLCA